MLKKVFFIINKQQTKKFYWCGLFNILFAILELTGLIALSGIVLLIVSPDVFTNKVSNLPFYSYLSNIGIDFANNLKLSYISFLLFFLLLQF